MSYEPPYKTIDSYRRRQRIGPLLISGLALVLIGAGVLFLWLWLSDSNLSQLSFQPSITPIPSGTPIPASGTPEASPTIDPSNPAPGVPTSTASDPFPYTVLEGDTLVALAEQFGLDPEIGFLLIMDYTGWGPNDFLQAAATVIIPPPDAVLFTPTPIPPNFPRLEEVIYRVLPGDTLASIAEKFLSTVDAIINANEIPNPSLIGVGDIVLVPYRVITATFGPPPTETPEEGGETETPTPTPTLSE